MLACAFTKRCRALPPAALAGCLLLFAGCKETLNAGANDNGPLHLDVRNPMVLVNDSGHDNWMGVYAALLYANAPGPGVVGIVVNADSVWPTMSKNDADWQSLSDAAGQSGLRGLPSPTDSAGAILVRPDSGDIEDTVPNRSTGALAIANWAKTYGYPYRPLVIATGGPLTDVADAYLVEPAIADRVVVVSSMGTLSSSSGSMGSPNGTLDPWADTIVAERLRYIQVSNLSYASDASASYDQLNDVTSSDLSRLPNNALGQWIANTQPQIFQWIGAPDQVSVMAVALPGFVLSVSPPMAPVGLVPAGATGGPDLAPSPNGRALLVTQVDGAVARQTFWQRLLDPKTYQP